MAIKDGELSTGLHNAILDDDFKYAVGGSIVGTRFGATREPGQPRRRPWLSQGLLRHCFLEDS